MKTINLPEWMADSLETEATLTLHFQPGHHPDSIIFLCLELTIFVTLLRQNCLFSLLLCRFHGTFMLE